MNLKGEPTDLVVLNMSFSVLMILALPTLIPEEGEDVSVEAEVVKPLLSLKGLRGAKIFGRKSARRISFRTTLLKDEAFD